jgi:hypothetical protein
MVALLFVQCGIKKWRWGKRRFSGAFGDGERERKAFAEGLTRADGDKWNVFCAWRPRTSAAPNPAWRARAVGTESPVRRSMPPPVSGWPGWLYSYGRWAKTQLVRYRVRPKIRGIWRPAYPQYLVRPIVQFSRLPLGLWFAIDSNGCCAKWAFANDCQNDNPIHFLRYSRQQWHQRSRATESNWS